MILGELLPFDAYTNAAIIITVFIILSIATYSVLSHLLRRALKTSTQIDNAVLERLKKPLTMYVLLTGVYFAVTQIPFFAQASESISNVFFVFSVLFFAYIITRVLGVIVKHQVQVGQGHEHTPRIFDLVISIVVFTLAGIMILQHYDIQITAIVAALGIGGLAVGLALQDTLTNLFAGLHLITAKPVRIGDYIELPDGQEGYVEDITWRSTRLRQIPNNIVIVPNRRMTDSILVNDSLPEQQIACLIECGVDYTSDLEHVERITLEIARNVQEHVEGARRDWNPFMRFHTFADSNINFRVYLRAEDYFARLLVTHEFIKQLKTRFDAEGIEISWPIRKVYHHNQ